MSKLFVLPLLTGAVWLAIASPAVAQNAKPASNDEAAIRKDVEAYAAAYNEGKLDAVGKHWAADAEYINDEGKVTKGRDAIIELFKKGRVATKGYSFKVDVQAVRLLKPDVALEDGTVTLTAPDGTAEKTRFSAILVKTDGNWRMSRVQDIAQAAEPDGAAPYDHLKQFEWMVGQWEDAEKEGAVRMNCHWTAGKAYLLQEYSIKRPNEEAFEVTQRIGWDPVNETIRSWIFDSKGGFCEGDWERKGNEWTAQIAGALPDGSTASARQVWTFTDDNHFKWQALDREVDSHPLASTTVTFRRAPAADAAASTDIRTPQIHEVRQ